ncbi:hypothetical protein HPP92_003456 [Vanilla planifolia]|uniref:Uncharacterized protein n=1 Tax=Vanilla planifolia TaxID=51239 RepID=A0A835S1T6_VANPL|nr:hypothetical protein HPP92_003456 [Vanilla planifolia]
MCPDEINVQERDSPHIELLPEHEQERPPTSIYQEVGCSELLFSTQCSGIPEQEKIMDAIVENEPPNLQSAEDIMHSLRTDQEPIGEVQSAIDLRGDGIQQVSLVQSFSSTRRIEVPAQQIIVDAATDNEPSCQQTSENAINPLRLQEDLPLQRTTTGDMLRYSFQPGLENQFQQTFPLMGWVPPQAICADPFKNELFRICRQVDSYNKKHEEKKAQLHLECEQEIEKVKRKYNDLIEDAERAYIHDKKMLQTLYDKVYLHKVLAEELRTKFYDHKEAATSFQGSSQILSQQLQASHPQPQPPPRTSSVAPPCSSLNCISAFSHGNHDT